MAAIWALVCVCTRSTRTWSFVPSPKHADTSRETRRTKRDRKRITRRGLVSCVLREWKHEGNAAWAGGAPTGNVSTKTKMSTCMDLLKVHGDEIHREGGRAGKYAKRKLTTCLPLVAMVNTSAPKASFSRREYVIILPKLPLTSLFTTLYRLLSYCCDKPRVSARQPKKQACRV